MNNFFRVFIYIFFPRRCWACFAPDSEVRVRYDYYDENWGRVECEWECGQCKETMAEMHYSPVYPVHPNNLKDRITFIQQELGKDWAWVTR